MYSSKSNCRIQRQYLYKIQLQKREKNLNSASFRDVQSYIKRQGGKRGDNLQQQQSHSNMVRWLILVKFIPSNIGRTRQDCYHSKQTLDVGKFLNLQLFGRVCRNNKVERREGQFFLQGTGQALFLLLLRMQYTTPLGDTIHMHTKHTFAPFRKQRSLSLFLLFFSLAKLGGPLMHFV